MQQQIQARRDVEERQRQQFLAAHMQQLPQEQSPFQKLLKPPAMTAGQRSESYSDSLTTPQKTFGVSEAQPQAEQKAPGKEKQHEAALAGDTVAIDLPHGSSAPSVTRPVQVPRRNGRSQAQRFIFGLDDSEWTWTTYLPFRNAMLKR